MGSRPRVAAQEGLKSRPCSALLTKKEEGGHCEPMSGSWVWGLGLTDKGSGQLPNGRRERLALAFRSGCLLMAVSPT